MIKKLIFGHNNIFSITEMIKYCRMNTIYSELYKSLKSSLISHTIILNMPSDKATKSAYDGIDYTINSIVKEIQAVYDIKIEDKTCTDTAKTFCITRNNNVYSTNINLKVRQLSGNQILFEFHIYV